MAVQRYTIYIYKVNSPMELDEPVNSPVVGPFGAAFVVEIWWISTEIQ